MDSHDEHEARLWKAHDWWRRLQMAGLWVTLFAPLWLVTAPDHCRYWAVGGTWLFALAVTGFAHFMRRRTVIKILVHENPEP